MSTPTRASRRAANSTASRTPVRSSNACERCRKQKIRCSGSQPCDACSKRSLACHFDENHQKVVVTKGYIRELQRKASQSRRSGRDGSGDIPVAHEDEANTTQSSSLDGPDAANLSRRPARSDERPSRTENSDSGEEPQMTNLLAQKTSTFMTASDGMTYYLGTTSNWTFTQKVLSMVYDRVFENRVPDVDRVVAGLGNAYDLEWNGISEAEQPSSVMLYPSIDHAMYLINAVKFHCKQLLHIFDEKTFMSELHAFYDKAREQQEETDRLWLVHFLMVCAFGKAFTVRKRNKHAPGLEYFKRALKLLPNMVYLWKHPVHSVELLACIALYLHSLDYRILAHNYIGQAMRLALNYGFHTDIQPGGFGPESIERIRRAWWQVFLLDREMSSLSGLPPALHREDVQCRLPAFTGSQEILKVLEMQLSLSDLMHEINRTVYGVGGQLNQRFQKGIEGALGRIATVQEELCRCFPIPTEQASGSISRTSAHLFLAYYRCIILATRPILFCFLKIRLDSRQGCHNRLNYSTTSRKIIQMCLDASIQIMVILELLLKQDLIDPFLPFDLDSISSASISIVLTMALDKTFVEKGSSWVSTAKTILDDMISSGNEVAAVRKAELHQLGDLLSKLEEVVDRPTASLPDEQAITTTRPVMSMGHATVEHVEQYLPASFASGAPLSQQLNFGASTGFGFDVDGADPAGPIDIMALADSMADIERFDPSWVSHIIGQDSIW